MKRPYVLTRSAEADLRDIVHYTSAQWGPQQCEAYVAALDERATALAQGQSPYKDMSSLLPGLRVAACGKHYIFCMPRPKAPALILAILHERMDILARLKSRLSG